MERARFIHGQHFYMSVLAIDFTEGGGGEYNQPSSRWDCSRQNIIPEPPPK